MIVMAGVVAGKHAFYARRRFSHEMSQTRLPTAMTVCYSTPPDEKGAANQQLARDSSGNALTACKKKEVDEISETLHTLPSSRLTNKTICRQAAGSTEQVL
jgi:hypothetical protein